MHRRQLSVSGGYLFDLSGGSHLLVSLKLQVHLELPSSSLWCDNFLASLGGLLKRTHRLKYFGMAPSGHKFQGASG